MIKTRTDECRLTKMLYVFDLEVNLLFDKRLIKKELKRSFNDNDLYMHNKQNMKVLTAFAREDVYIMNQIKFELDKLALTIIMTLVTKSMTIFSALSAITNTKKSQTFSSMQLDELHHESNHFSSSLEDNTSSKKRDLYTL